MARAPVRRMVSIAMAAVSGPSSDTKSRKPSPNQRDLHRRRADLSCDSALTFPGAMEESASPDDRMLGIGCGAQGCEEVRGTRQRVSPKPQVLVWHETMASLRGRAKVLSTEWLCRIVLAGLVGWRWACLRLMGAGQIEGLSGSEIYEFYPSSNRQPRGKVWNICGRPAGNVFGSIAQQKRRTFKEWFWQVAKDFGVLPRCSPIKGWSKASPVKTWAFVMSKCLDAVQLSECSPLKWGSARPAALLHISGEQFSRTSKRLQPKSDSNPILPWCWWWAGWP